MFIFTLIFILSNLCNNFAIKKKGVGNKVGNKISINFDILIITPLSVIIGYLETEASEHGIVNHLQLIFKTHMYAKRKNDYLSIDKL